MAKTKDRIIELRKKLNLTRANLAKLLECNYRTIYYWETGARNPGFKHAFELTKIAKKQGIQITIDWIRPDNFS
jgi:DNA-binding XRE family transcriptional regulator